MLLVFGARPNFMKIAPVHRALQQRAGMEPLLVHTGQHFDKEMSGGFLEALELPAPDVHLDVGPGPQARQLAEVIRRLEPVVRHFVPDVAVVVGDVTSTLSAALCASMLEVPVAHVEAGLRSFDWRMPEECNRVLTDRLSEYLFTHSAEADANLRAEGIEESRILRVGNVMIDSLDWVLPRLRPAQVREAFGVEEKTFGLVTLHRPGNVDDPAAVTRIIRALKHVAEEIPLLFPIHPRTRRRLTEFGIELDGGPLRQLPPLGYVQFISLLSEASIVLTDSGGIQEEAVVLGVPCLTLRESTERPVTIRFGSNDLVGSDPQRIVERARQRIRGARPEGMRPPLWDGNAAERIVEILAAADRS